MAVFHLHPDTSASWRTTSHLKRRYGWDRSLVNGRDRTTTWCGYGVLAHNLVKVARLATHNG
jgi:IS5 family transposase